MESSRKLEAPARKFSDLVRGKPPITEKPVTHTQHSIPLRITCDASAKGSPAHSSNFDRQDYDAIIDDVEFSVRKRTERFFFLFFVLFFCCCFFFFFFFFFVLFCFVFCRR